MAEDNRRQYDELSRIASQQRGASIKYKSPRLTDIRKSVELYLGKSKPQLRIPNNVAVPVMSGLVDHTLSKIDDAPLIEFAHQDLADLKKARKATAAWQRESNLPLADAKWNLKDRYAKKLAILSGRAILKYYSESDPEYRSVFEVVHYEHFHCEPDGGGILDNHLFKGQDNVFKTKEQLVEGAKRGMYDKVNVHKIVSQDPDSREHNLTENASTHHSTLGLDPLTNNYTGQTIFNLTEWYMTFKGKKWYLLFDPQTQMWVRVEPLRDLFSSNLDPYVSWATHEDDQVFWSKAIADDFRPIAQSISDLFNQELYNRQKQNFGEKFVDTEFLDNPQDLNDHRPDKIITFDSRQGNVSPKEFVYHVETPQLKGTLDLISFADSFFGQKAGSTPGSQGVAESNKKVGVFFGELQQLDELLGLRNKSYSEAYEELGLRYLWGLKDNFKGELPVKLLGATGVEWDVLTRDDMKTVKDLDVKIVGGTRGQQENDLKSAKKIAALDAVSADPNLIAVMNPQMVAKQKLRDGGFAEEEISLLTDVESDGDEILMSEAAQSIQDILKGKEPKLNRGADLAFMQKIVDFAMEHDVEQPFFEALMNYAQDHMEIVVENMARKASQPIPAPAGAGVPVGNPLEPAIAEPTPANAQRVGQQFTNSVKQDVGQITKT